MEDIFGYRRMLDSALQKAMPDWNSLARQFSGLTEANNIAAKIISDQRAQALEVNTVFQNTFSAMLANIGAPAQVLNNSIAQITDSLSTIKKSMYSISMLPSHRFYESLPVFLDVSESARKAIEILREQEAEDQRIADQVLSPAELSFVADYFNARAFRDFATVAPRVRTATIVNSLKGYVNSQGFYDSLAESATSSPTVRKRWHIIEKGMYHQKQRDYIVSIPVLMPQFEGLLADILTLRTLVVREGSKVYKLDATTGQRSLNKKGKPIELSGLSPLINHSGYRKSAELRFLAEHVANRLCDQRNGVLHGADTRYHTPKLSISLVLLIATMVDAIVDLEKPAAQ